MKIRIWRLLFLVLFSFSLQFAYGADSSSFNPTSVSITAAQPSSGSPAGTIIAWPASSLPAGWLECNGATFNSAAFPKLYAALGTNRLPDLRGEFIRGWDHGKGADPGRSLGSAQSDELKTHSHNIPTYVYRNDADAPIPRSVGTATSGQKIAGPDLSTSAHGGHETRPRNVAMMYIIKAE